MRTQHMVTWYSKTTDRRIGSTPLRGLSTPALRQLFHAPAGDPMFDSFAVRSEQAAALQRHIHHKLRLDRYDYFVECEAARTPQRQLQAS